MWPRPWRDRRKCALIHVACLQSKRRLARHGSSGPRAIALRHGQESVPERTCKLRASIVGLGSVVLCPRTHSTRFDATYQIGSPARERTVRPGTPYHLLHLGYDPLASRTTTSGTSPARAPRRYRSAPASSEQPIAKFAFRRNRHDSTECARISGAAERGVQNRFSRNRSS